MPVEYRDLPISTKEVHKFLRKRLRVEEPQLASSLTSKEIHRVEDYCTGYYNALVNNPPSGGWTDEVVQGTILNRGYEFLIKNLTE